MEILINLPSIVSTHHRKGKISRGGYCLRHNHQLIISRGVLPNTTNLF